MTATQILWNQNGRLENFSKNKSTLICISGSSENTDQANKSIGIEIKKIIGYLPENNPLYDDMEVITFLDFIADIRKINKQQKKKVLVRLLKNAD